MRTVLRFAATGSAFAILAVAIGCQVRAESEPPLAESSGDAAHALPAHALPAHASPSRDSPSHVIRVYVSAVNCEMNAADGRRVNQLARTGGMPIEVVFTGVRNGDSSIVESAKRDLRLEVPARAMRPDELEQYKSIGGVQLPVALVIKARQLKTLITGESMPRTLSLLEASMSPTGGQ